MPQGTIDEGFMGTAMTTAGSVTIALIVGQGGGINLGVITLLPNLIGGGIQRSAALLLTTANIQVTVTAAAVTVTVTGAAGRTMNWVGQVEVIGVEP